jgi:hypothetical protein
MGSPDAGPHASCPASRDRRGQLELELASIHWHSWLVTQPGLLECGAKTPVKTPITCQPDREIAYLAQYSVVRRTVIASFPTPGSRSAAVSNPAHATDRHHFQTPLHFLAYVDAGPLQVEETAEQDSHPVGDARVGLDPPQSFVARRDRDQQVAEAAVLHRS